MNRRRFLTLFGIGAGVIAAVPVAMSLPRQRTPSLIVGKYDDVPIWPNTKRFEELPIGSVYEPLTNREEVWIKTGKYARRLEPNSFLEIIPNNELMLHIGSAREER